MPPLTLTILASVLQMQGADATLTSDNKGVEELLAPIRGQLQEKIAPNSSPQMFAATHHRGLYTKIYTRVYAKYDFGAGKPGGGTTVAPAGGAAMKPAGGGSSGGGHR